MLPATHSRQLRLRVRHLLVMLVPVLTMSASLLTVMIMLAPYNTRLVVASMIVVLIPLYVVLACVRRAHTWQVF
ncbi:uncharacterized protein C8Q71DRAFT_777957, partial [Rhodofomes roseus]